MFKEKTKQNSAHNNLFLRLMHNPQVKKVCHCIYRQLFFAFVLFCFIFFLYTFHYIMTKDVEEEAFVFFLQFSNLNFSFTNIIFITYNKMWRASMLSCFPLLF